MGPGYKSPHTDLKIAFHLVVKVYRSTRVEVGNKRITINLKAPLLLRAHFHHQCYPCILFTPTRYFFSTFSEVVPFRTVCPVCLRFPFKGADFICWIAKFKENSKDSEVWSWAVRLITLFLHSGLYYYYYIILISIIKIHKIHKIHKAEVDFMERLFTLLQYIVLYAL